MLDQEAVTPGGKFVGAPIPVAPVVVKVIEGNTLLAHREGLILGPVTVLSGVTVIVPDALAVPQPPTRGIV